MARMTAIWSCDLDNVHIFCNKGWGKVEICVKRFIPWRSPKLIETKLQQAFFVGVPVTLCLRSADVGIGIRGLEGTLRRVSFRDTGLGFPWMTRTIITIQAYVNAHKVFQKLAIKWCSSDSINCHDFRLTRHCFSIYLILRSDDVKRIWNSLAAHLETESCGASDSSCQKRQVCRRSTSVRLQVSAECLTFSQRYLEKCCYNSWLRVLWNNKKDFIQMKYVKLWARCGNTQTSQPLEFQINEVTTASRSSASCNISCWCTVAGATEGLCPHMAFGKVAAFIRMFDSTALFLE